MKKFLIGGGIFVLVAFIATGVALLKYTQVEWWIPAGAAAVIAIVTIPLTAMLRAKRKRKTGIWEMCLHVAIVGSVAFGGIMALNRFAPGTAEHNETGTVIQKYSREHTQYRGVRRRHPVGKTRQYYILVQMPDSSTVEMPVSVEKYNRTRTGARMNFDVRTGFLGWPVMV